MEEIKAYCQENETVASAASHFSDVAGLSPPVPSLDAVPAPKNSILTLPAQIPNKQKTRGGERKAEGDETEVDGGSN